MPEWFAIWILVALGLAFVIGVIVWIKDGYDEGFEAFLGAIQGFAFISLLIIVIVMAISSLA